MFANMHLLIDTLEILKDKSNDLMAHYAMRDELIAPFAQHQEAHD